MPKIGAFGAIWIATILLFVISPLVASESLSNSAIQAMLPLAGILAVAAVGQTLVIQQGGLDLSVPGMFSLGVVLVVVVPGGDPSQLGFALLLVAAVGLAGGLLNGLAISRLGITPLVATLGMNGILIGVVLTVTGGSINFEATSNWSDFASSKVAGIPMIFVVAIAFVIVMQILLRRTVWGRRFDLVGANPAAARAAGLRVERVQLSSYVIAGFCYAMAGALLAGYLGRPQLFAGEEYLLTSIAAVVLGGTALGGGRGSVVATFAGVLFISQLNQVVLLLGATQAVQFMIQGTIIALGMGLRNVPWHSLRGGKAEGSESDPPPSSGQVEGPGSSDEVDPQGRITEAGGGAQAPSPGVVKQ